MSYLHFLPRSTPAMAVMLEDLGNPSARAIARAMGVHERTVERWRSLGRAPKPVMLALFFATRWGRSAVNCQAVNDARLYFGYASALRTELDAANAKLARLGQIGEFGSANDPAPGAPAGAPQSTVVAHAGQPLATTEEPVKPARLTRAN
ncbi:helix-turn-helix domain-containing protein [Pelomonas aquatica]|jgi:hypothetical protein|uniref:Uncharacterized protein n=1 Tax=Pelomonas aquatica TaxID=431058 RepID=A0A9X4R965_9BURK|nr:helix-turn-helix domain-containing protein [Pelomonas aquatica]MCY4756704.1 helix-turn-helix domain-containing protein [Pelomonas aquatica]MDG0863998.1 hypothetical protein [Pelomonas aquatica]